LEGIGGSRENVDDLEVLLELSPSENGLLMTGGGGERWRSPFRVTGGGRIWRKKEGSSPFFEVPSLKKVSKGRGKR